MTLTSVLYDRGMLQYSAVLATVMQLQESCMIAVMNAEFHNISCASNCVNNFFATVMQLQESYIIM